MGIIKETLGRSVEIDGRRRTGVDHSGVVCPAAAIQDAATDVDWGLARERRGRQRPKIQKQKGRHMHDLLVIARIFSFDLCALVSSFFSLLTKLRSS